MPKEKENTYRYVSREIGDRKFLLTCTHNSHPHGFYSCNMQTYAGIIQLLKQGARSIDIDFSQSHLAWKTEKDYDLYPYIFKKAENPILNSRTEWRGLSDKPFHHAHYRDLDFSRLNIITQSYFSPSDIVDQKRKEIFRKYRIDLKNSVAVVYRGTDKYTEVTLASPETYVKLAQRLLRKEPALMVVIQTDQLQVWKLFKDTFKDRVVALEEVPMTEGTTPIHLTVQSNDRLKFAVNLDATVRVLSQCKYVINHTGNLGCFLALYRQSSQNMYQFDDKGKLVRPSNGGLWDHIINRLILDKPRELVMVPAADRWKMRLNIFAGEIGQTIKKRSGFFYKLLKPFFPDVEVEPLFIRRRLKNRGFIYRKELLKKADEVLYFGENEIIDYPRPKIFNPISRKKWRWINGRYVIEKPFVCRIADGEVVGSWAWGFTKDKKMIVESGIFFWSRFWFPLPQECEQQFKYLNTPIQAEFDTVMPLINELAFTNYYHWIIERLTLLEAAEVYEKKKGIRPQLLVSFDIKPWQKELLNILGYFEKDFLYWKGGHARVKNLLIANMRRYSENKNNPYDALSPAACQWIQKKVLGSVQPEKNHRFAKRIYISRYKDAERRILNEDAVMTILQKFGFERYYLIGMSVADQVNLFNGADVILSPHGAALTNLLWAKKGTKVLEIQNEKYFNHVFHQISMAVGLHYSTIILPDMTTDYDMEVDVKVLEKILYDFI